MKFSLAKHIELGMVFFCFFASMVFENSFLLARSGGGVGPQKGFWEEVNNHLLR